MKGNVYRYLTRILYCCLFASVAFLATTQQTHASATCGDYHQQDFTGDYFVDDLDWFCDTWTPSDFTYYDDWSRYRTWTCNDTDTVICSADYVVEWECWPYNDEVFTGDRFVNNISWLCNNSEPADFTYYNWDYRTWSCLWEWQGSNDFCSASLWLTDDSYNYTLTWLVAYYAFENNFEDSHSGNDLWNNWIYSFVTWTLNTWLTFWGATFWLASLSDRTDFRYWTTGDFSYSFWYKPFAFVAWAHFFDKAIAHNWSSARFSIFANTAGGWWAWQSVVLYMQNTAGAGVSITIPNPLTANVWSHLVFTRSNSWTELRGYWNWNLMVTLTGQTAYNFDSTSNLAIWDSPVNWLHSVNWVFDEIAIYKGVALSPAQVSALYNFTNIEWSWTVLSWVTYDEYCWEHNNLVVWTWVVPTSFWYDWHFWQSTDWLCADWYGATAVTLTNEWRKRSCYEKTFLWFLNPDTVYNECEAYFSSILDGACNPDLYGSYISAEERVNLSEPFASPLLCQSWSPANVGVSTGQTASWTLYTGFIRECAGDSGGIFQGCYALSMTGEDLSSFFSWYTNEDNLWRIASLWEKIPPFWRLLWIYQTYLNFWYIWDWTITIPVPQISNTMNISFVRTPITLYNPQNLWKSCQWNVCTYTNSLWITTSVEHGSIYNFLANALPVLFALIFISAQLWLLYFIVFMPITWLSSHIEKISSVFFLETLKEENTILTLPLFILRITTFFALSASIIWLYLDLYAWFHQIIKSSIYVILNFILTGIFRDEVLSMAYVVDLIQYGFLGVLLTYLLYAGWKMFKIF